MKSDHKIYNISLKVSVIATALWSGTLAVLLTDIIRNYSLEGTSEGLMSSMISIGALAALFASILFLGRRKKTHNIVFFGFLTSAVLVAQGIPMPFALFLLACFVMGFGHGIVDSYQSSFLADLNMGSPKSRETFRGENMGSPKSRETFRGENMGSPKSRETFRGENRGKTAKHMGALHAIFGVGGVLTPIILHELLKSFDWHTIYIIVGVVCFILIAQFAAVSRYMKSRFGEAHRIEPKLTAAGMKEFFSNRYSVLLILTIFFGAAAQSGIIVWTIRYVSVSLGSPDIAAICLSIFWITSTVSRFFSPMLPIAPSRILAYGAFISAVVWAAALTVNEPLIMCIASGITGLVSGSCIPLTLSEGAVINSEKTGLSTNILMASKTIGQILSPVVVAFVMSLGDMQTGMYVTSALFLLNGVFAALMIKNSNIFIRKEI